MPRAPRSAAGNYRSLGRSTTPRKTTRKAVSKVAGTSKGLIGQKMGVGKAIRPPANPRPDTGKRLYSRASGKSRRRV